MDLTLTIAESLRRIYELRDGKRHQRRVNRETFLRLMGIYVELQSLESNAALQRSNVVETFAAAVINFLRYLQRYNGMSRVARLVRRRAMKERRQAISDEIDRVVQMLNLAATMEADTSVPKISQNSDPPKVKHQADPSRKKALLAGALQVACQHGRLDTARILLDGGASVDQQDENGKFPLLAACSNGNVALVELLLDKRASIDLADNCGWTALMAASQEGHADTVRVLLRTGALVDQQRPNGETALIIACQRGRLEATRALIHGGASVNLSDSNGDAPLIWASSKGHAPIVQILIEGGASMESHSKTGWTALMKATERGQLNVVKLLLKSSANINAQGLNGATALNIACEHDQLSIVVLLVNHGAALEQADEASYTPLITAAQLGHSDVVQFLVTRGANVNARLPSGGTALLTAVWYKRLAVVRILLDNGADITLCGDFQNWPPLTVSYMSGYIEFTQLIYERVGPDFSFPGDQPTSSDSDKATDLHLVIGKKFRNGDTALRIACEQGNLKAAKKNLQHRDDIDKVDTRELKSILAMQTENQHYRLRARTIILTSYKPSYASGPRSTYPLRTDNLHYTVQLQAETQL
ncbi:hypothetical protein PR002_g21044 [Phytophthora rubi]|uniref:Uncharacterized protein n=1 Tax=Phytophthora rubi TaxID=129364 RepID=A0A6A3J6A7_9STRA|nr:hypothetical protein PR002_g21044 [Phytophthora rubi]